MLTKKLEQKWPTIRFTKAFIKSFVSLTGLTFPIWGAILIAIIGLGLTFALFEKIRIFDAIYYAFISAMTVGYGDITPETRIGKVISIFIGLLGIIATGIIVANALQAVKITYEKEIEDPKTPAEKPGGNGGRKKKSPVG